IVLQILPEERTQGVLRIGSGIQDLAQDRACFAWLRKLERRLERKNFPVEANNIDPLTVLRNPPGGVNDLREHPVAEFFERIPDHRPRLALVVREQVLDVFEKDYLRPFRLNDGCKLEKKRALSGVPEAVASPKTVLFRDTGEGERLTGESGGKNVVRRNLLRLEFPDIPKRDIAEPGFIGAARILVPLAGEAALAAEFFEGDAEAPDAGEEIYESEGGHGKVNPSY